MRPWSSRIRFQSRAFASSSDSGAAWASQTSTALNPAAAISLQIARQAASSVAAIVLLCWSIQWLSSIAVAA